MHGGVRGRRRKPPPTRSEVFAEEARKLDGIEFLAQGTIWPDIIESEEGIKAHHNAGGLPEDMDFELVEPVRILVVPEFRSTGIKNGKRAFEWCCIVRAVCSTDVMTATAAEIPHEVMVHITDRITHEVAGINRVLYDFTPKPTGTVEFE